MSQNFISPISVRKQQIKTCCMHLFHPIVQWFSCVKHKLKQVICVAVIIFAQLNAIYTISFAIFFITEGLVLSSFETDTHTTLGSLFRIRLFISYIKLCIKSNLIGHND